MITPDEAPIPPATLRVSVVWTDGRHEPHTVDIVTGAIVQTLRWLEDHVAPALAFAHTGKATYAAMAAAMKAADDGDVRVVTSVGLWLFMHPPSVEHAVRVERLRDALEHHGAALILAVVGRGGGGWTFRLHEMPRWPAAGAVTEKPAPRRCG